MRNPREEKVLRFASAIIVILILCPIQLQARMNHMGSLKTPDPIIVDGQSFKPIDIGTNMSILEDESKQLKLQEVSRLTFVPARTQVQHMGFKDSNFWSRFYILNQSPHPAEYILESQYVSLDYVILYQEIDEKYIEVRNGDRVIKDSPYVVKSRTASFIVKLKPGKNTFYTRISSRGVIEINFKLWPIHAFYQKLSYEYLFFSSVLGIIVIMTLYNSALYIIIKEKAYLYYVIYTASNLILFVAQLGFGAIFVPNSILFANEGYLFFGTAALVSAIVFSSMYLDLKKNARWIHNSLMAMAFITLGSMLIITPVNYGLAAKLVVVANNLFYPCLLIVGFVMLFRRKRSAYYYVIAWSFYITSATIYTLCLVGKIEKNVFTTNGIYVGAVADLFLFSIGVGDKIRRRQKKSDAMELALREALEQKNQKVLELNRKLEERVDDKTREMTAIFDNIELGIFLISRDCKVQKEYSNAIHSIFDRKEIAGIDPIALIHGSSNTDAANMDKAALSFILGEPPLNFEVNKHSLSKEVTITTDNGVKIVNLDWNAIEKDGVVDRLITTARDVTGERELRLSSEKRDLDVKIIKELTGEASDRIMKFFEASEVFLAHSLSIIQSTDRFNSEAATDLFINAHTLKGMARSMNFSELKDAVHLHEDFLTLIRHNPSLWQHQELMSQHLKIMEIVDRYQQINTNILGRVKTQPAVEIPLDDALEILARLDSLSPQSDSDLITTSYIKSIIVQKFYVTGADLKSDILISAGQLARDLNKEEPSIEVDDSRILISQEGKKILSNILLHLIRNSMDHGIEPPGLRLAQGKDSRGQLTIILRARTKTVDIVFFDDGRGLNLNLIEEAAVAKGLIEMKGNRSIEQIAALIFEPGFSTSSRITHISGRGIGMDAVRRFAENAGGTIRIELSSLAVADHQPFKIVLSLPRVLFYFNES